MVIYPHEYGPPGGVRKREHGFDQTISLTHLLLELLGFAFS